ncbi:MAG TPA: LptF/LptG family permease [Tepidisphaeraceae bacterium]|jgi:lipopolysaccharide export LptBFGC system permease protein LptF|nr:LptF/LptG family permease [Tepidisphaeraceae bacterium]
MSRTLFAYIFKDLFRIFMMASGAMAGIMSFGGLLRPLTREGLDAGQVARMLTYFGPAMTTYSFPVAALFATAVVYGRLAADNELTACKAGGMSLLSFTVAGPALVLGLVVAIASLLFLCFIVPASTLKVEQVIYSNLAKMVESRIERTHRIEMPQSTIFAQEAHVIPPGPDTPPGQQQVELIGPEIISDERDPHDRTLHIPKEFYTATRAYVYIDPMAGGQAMNVTIRLTGGFKFPRRFQGATNAGVAETWYGPTEFPSPIKEDVKFMNVFRLKELYDDLSKSRKIQTVVGDFVKTGERQFFVADLMRDLRGPSRQTVFRFDNDNSYTLGTDDPKVAVFDMKGEIIFPYPPAKPAALKPGTNPDSVSVDRPVIFRQQKKGQGTLVVRAASVTVHVRPRVADGMADVSVDLRDCLQTMESVGAAAEPVRREKFTQQFSVPLGEEARELPKKDIAYFQTPAAKDFGNQELLEHEKVTVINQIIAESNGRASFAISCLILVMAGCALGMMFRSGNFLTAFAVSFVPAMMSITLIIAGQRTAGNVPTHFNGHNNTLQLGLTLIWAGNAVNLILAICLLWKLGRR